MDSGRRADLARSCIGGSHHTYAPEDEWFGGPFIGSWLLDRMQRDVIAADLPARRTKGWMKQAV